MVPPPPRRVFRAKRCCWAATDADTLFRGSSRAWPWTYARVADDLHPAAPRVVEVAAAGRVSNDQSEWLQVLADVLGRPVTHVTRPRATSVARRCSHSTCSTRPPAAAPGHRSDVRAPARARRALRGPARAVRRGLRRARGRLRGPGTSEIELSREQVGIPGADAETCTQARPNCVAELRKYDRDAG